MSGEHVEDSEDGEDDAPSIADVFVDHLDIPLEEAENLTEWFASSVWGNPTGFYERSKDIHDLIMLKEAISTIIRFRRTSSYEVGDLLRMEILNLLKEVNISNCSENSDVTRHEAYDLWYKSVKHMHKFKKAIDNSINKISHSRLSLRAKSRVNTEAVNIVDRARKLWRTFHGKPAPAKGLNDATAFAGFLSDLFVACECDADPRSAFQAWVRYMGEPVHSENEND